MIVDKVIITLSDYENTKEEIIQPVCDMRVEDNILIINDGITNHMNHLDWIKNIEFSKSKLIQK